MQSFLLKALEAELLEAEHFARIFAELFEAEAFCKDF